MGEGTLSEAGAKFTGICSRTQKTSIG